MENLNRFFESMKKLMSLKRTKVTLYIAAVLWLAVATQMIMNRVLYEDLGITQAFVNTNSGELKSSIEVIAEYNKEFLSEEDKKDILLQIASDIGLTVDKEITVLREGSRSEYSYSKQARKASTELKVVSMEQKEEASIKMQHYIVIRLDVMESIHSIDKFRKKIEKTLQEIGVENKQVTVQYEGSFDGALSSEEKKRISNLLIDELQGKAAMKYEEDDIYTVYAYTGLINEYIVSMGSKVNIQIAISYDEKQNKTVVYLATPILNQSW